MRAPRQALRVVAALASCLALGACDRIQHLIHGPGFDTQGFEAALDPVIGGPDTCVVILEEKDGEELYRYGDHAVCNRPLAPCATFNAPMALIGLDSGAITPATVFRYDGSPQSAQEWKRDTTLAGAFQWGAPWWWRKLAGLIGPARFAQWLPSIGYGPGKAAGDPLAFWQGPAAGGALYISTNDQASFLRRLYRGELPVSASASRTVEGLMVEETRGPVTLSGLTGSCPSIADSSRNLGWWVGRIAGPDRTLIFAMSIEGANALPGMEIRSRMTPILARYGLLPPT
ncbi:MAG TPA: penicillin-binding transpeptidase domain-containing protein [Caulobacteraceae bacterium]|nr:penicillin-binding transpeptidase domain-containing protein [Caulobacteraceae bacterium]